MSYPAAGAALLALALSLPPAASQGVGSWCEAAGFLLELPEAWRVERDAPGRGLVLRPPGEGAPPVEVITWRVSVGVWGPEQAAAEHERVLAARRPYQRTSLAAAASPGAGEALVVRGLIPGRDGARTGSLFAVFTRGTRAYAVGLFAPVEELDSARVRYLDPVLARLVLTAPDGDTAPAGPPPPTRDIRPVVPAEPAVSAQPLRTGEGVAAAPVRPSEAGGAAGGVTPAEPIAPPREDPAGFALTLPEGWHSVLDNRVVRASGPNRAALFLAPVLADGAGRLDLEDFTARCLGSLGDARLLTSTSRSSSADAAWTQVTAEAGGTALEGRFSLSLGAPTSLLAGFIAPVDDLEHLLPLAAEMIASFSAEAALPPDAATGVGADWTDAAGLLASRRPAGWVLRGGIERYDHHPVISVEGRAEDGAAWFTWRQPVRPIFRDLTDAMQGLGFRDGDPYYAYDGVDPRMVLTRGATRELARRHLLPRDSTPLGPDPLVVEEQRIEGLQLIGHAREEVGLTALASAQGLAGGTAWLLAARAPLGELTDGWFWEAAGVGVGGEPGRVADAARALETVVRSAAVGPQADAETRSGLAPLVGRSQAALGAAPWRSLVGERALTPALGGSAAGDAGRDRIVTPPSAVTAWRALASGARASYNAAGAEPR